MGMVLWELYCHHVCTLCRLVPSLHLFDFHEIINFLYLYIYTHPWHEHRAHVRLNPVSKIPDNIPVLDNRQHNVLLGLSILFHMLGLYQLAPPKSHHRCGSHVQHTLSRHAVLIHSMFMPCTYCTAKQNFTAMKCWW